MISGLMDMIVVILVEAWNVLVSFKIPGTNFSPAVITVSIALISTGMRILRMVLGSAVDGGESYRSSSRRGKISEERQGDEK